MTMTKAEMFRAIATIDGMTDEMKEFLEKEARATEKRNARRSSVESPKKKANAEIMGKVMTILDGSDKPLKIAEIVEALGETYSTQKMNGIMHPYIYSDENPSGTIARIVQKKDVRFWTVDNFYATKNDEE